MFDVIDRLFDTLPYLALFIAIALGYLAGKITIGRYVLGAIAGTLLVGVAVGQFGVTIDPGVKTIFLCCLSMPSAIRAVRNSPTS